MAVQLRIYDEGGSKVVAAYDDNKLLGESPYTSERLVATSAGDNTINISDTITNNVIFGNIRYTDIKTWDNNTWGTTKALAISALNEFFRITPFNISNVKGLTNQSGYIFINNESKPGTVELLPVTNDGEQGPQGFSAFDIWINQGNLGSVEDFLNSLIGPQGPQGPTGPAGPIGPKGDQGAQGAQGIQGPIGATGPTGPQGPQGPQGEDGTSITILGSLANESELPATGNLGEGYLIVGDLYIWNGGAWENVGTIQGPQGEPGLDGETPTLTIGTVTTGAAGTQATATITGTSPNLVLNLTIPQGQDGVDGVDGANGTNGVDGQSATITVGGVTTGAAGTNATVINAGTGPDAIFFFTIPRGFPGTDGTNGTDGTDGLTAYEIAQNAGFSGTEAEWLTSLNGVDGINGVDGTGFTGGSYDSNTGVITFTSDDGLGFTTNDLRGTDGTNGTNGVDGDSAYQIAVNNGFVGTEQEWLTSLEGTDGINGSDGQSATIVVESTTTGEPGTNATVVNAGTSLAASLRFTIPRGATGAQGIQGEQGIQGPQGEQGIQGIQGIQGPAGNDGNTILYGAVDPTTEGNDGDFYINTSTNFLFGPKATTWPAGVSLVGPQGIQGIQGIQGEQGIQGIQGEVGPQGETGNGIQSTVNNGDGTFTITFTDATTFITSDFTGPQGIQGIQGEQGIQGIQGPQGIPGVDGNRIWYGDGLPTAFAFAYQQDDFFIQTTEGSETLWGPYDAVTAWAAASTPITGPQGPQGIQGLPGADGADGTNGLDGADGLDGQDGTSILNGLEDPLLVTGNAGDFYINTATNVLFGPKLIGQATSQEAWQYSSAISLVPVVSDIAFDVIELTGTSNTIQESHLYKYIRINNSSATDYIINSSTYPVGAEIVIEQSGAGQVTIVPSGVTIRSSQSLKSYAQYAVMALKLVPAAVGNEWVLSGEREAV